MKFPDGFDVKQVMWTSVTFNWADAPRAMLMPALKTAFRATRHSLPAVMLSKPPGVSLILCYAIGMNILTRLSTVILSEPGGLWKVKL